MQKSDSEIKELVKTAYAKAISQPGSGCCGGASATVSEMKGNLVKLAGYTPDELNRLPADAVTNAFGCGNPLAFSGVKAGDVVLDIGSGAGIDCLLAAEKVGVTGRVIGIDMTPAMIEKARDNAHRAGAANVEFRLGDADNMPVADAAVDWVISNCVINLAPDKDKVFSEIYRVLKPGGRVAISDIVLGTGLPEAIRDDVEALVGCVAGALQEQVYLQKMRDAGLENVTVTDRIIYAKEQVLGLAENNDDGGCSSPVKYDRRENLEQIEGQVWSARIAARKPLVIA